MSGDDLCVEDYVAVNNSNWRTNLAACSGQISDRSVAVLGC